MAHPTSTPLRHYGVGLIFAGSHGVFAGQILMHLAAVEVNHGDRIRGLQCLELLTNFKSDPTEVLKRIAEVKAGQNLTEDDKP